MNTKKLHFFSGITIIVFIIFHLFNHLVSILGVESHIELMNTLRIVYRNIFVETLLLLAVLIQIVSGLKLVFAKRKKIKKGFEKLQYYSGAYLAMFFIIHLSAILVGRMVLKLDTNVYFGAAGINTFPFNLFFVPYYFLAIMAFFGHVASIHSFKMRKTVFGIKPKQQSKIILMLGFLMAVTVFYGLTNGFSGIEIPKEYGIMIGK